MGTALHIEGEAVNILEEIYFKAPVGRLVLR